MKKLILGTAVLALSAGLALADGDGKTVRMGTEGAYAPWNFVNDAGEIDGFERELGDELCMRAELKCEWVKNDWDSIIPNLVSGNYDTIIAGMSITDERDEVIDFTQPYTPPDPSTYAALDSGLDVEGAVIAAQAATPRWRATAVVADAEPQAYPELPQAPSRRPEQHLKESDTPTDRITKEPLPISFLCV